MDDYYTLPVTISEIDRLKFKATTGYHLPESLTLELVYDETGYKLFTIDGKLVVYNDILSLTNQRVTEESLTPFGVKV